MMSFRRDRAPASVATLSRNFLASAIRQRAVVSIQMNSRPLVGIWFGSPSQMRRRFSKRRTSWTKGSLTWRAASVTGWPTRGPNWPWPRLQGEPGHEGLLVAVHDVQGLRLGQDGADGLQVEAAARDLRGPLIVLQDGPESRGLAVGPVDPLDGVALGLGDRPGRLAPGLGDLPVGLLLGLVDRPLPVLARLVHLVEGRFDEIRGRDILQLHRDQADPGLVFGEDLLHLLLHLGGHGHAADGEDVAPQPGADHPAHHRLGDVADRLAGVPGPGEEVDRGPGPGVG